MATEEKRHSCSSDVVTAPDDKEFSDLSAESTPLDLFFGELQSLADHLQKLISDLPRNFNLNLGETKLLDSSIHQLCTVFNRPRVLEASGELQALVNSVESELAAWKGYMVASPLTFVERVSSTLAKYTEFAKVYFGQAKFTQNLIAFTDYWTTSSEEEWVAVSEDRMCEFCNHARAQLDLQEMNSIVETETLVGQVKELGEVVGQLRQEIQQLTSKHQQQYPLEQFYLEHLTKIRTDIENLADCDLPKLQETTVHQDVPELWRAIRKSVAELSKKARNKTGEVTEAFKCSYKDLEAICEELKCILADREETRCFKLAIGNKAVAIAVKEEPEAHPPIFDYNTVMKHTLSGIAGAFLESIKEGTEESANPRTEPSLKYYKERLSNCKEAYRQLKMEFDMLHALKTSQKQENKEGVVKEKEKVNRPRIVIRRPIKT